MTTTKKKKKKKKKKVADNLSPLQPLGVHSSIIKFDFTVVAHSRGHSKKTINVSHFTRNPGGSKPQKNEKEKKIILQPPALNVSLYFSVEKIKQTSLSSDEISLFYVP